MIAVDRDHSTPAAVDSAAGVVHLRPGDTVVRFQPISDDVVAEQRLTVFAVASPRQVICWTGERAPTLTRVSPRDIAGVIQR